MPLCRPRANSLQLSVERLRVTTWHPARPPTPRRSTYPQPGTTSVDMAGIVGSDVPPVPPLSYWEPETPSPMSPYHPFLNPPADHPASLKAVASPLLPASPLSIFDSRTAPRSWSFPVPFSSPRAGPELSPRFLNPRTPPLPPATKPASTHPHKERRRSTMCSVPLGKLDKIKNHSMYAMVVAAQGEVLAEMKREEAQETTGRGDGFGLVHRYNTVKRRRERCNMVKGKSFQVLKQVDVEV